MYSEWSSLPLPVVFLILDNLLKPTDYLRFASVCEQWRLLARDYNHSTKRWHKWALPMFMRIIAEPQATWPTLELYSILQGTKLHTTISVHLPNPNPSNHDMFTKIDGELYGFGHGLYGCGHGLYGCGHGWFAHLDFHHHPYLRRYRCHITLMSPFRKSVAIQLPQLETPDCSSSTSTSMVNLMSNIILSDDPILNPDKFMVMAACIYNKSKFAVIRGGEKYWTFVDPAKDEEQGLGFFPTATFYQGKVYTTDWVSGNIVAVDFHSFWEIRKPVHSIGLINGDSNSLVSVGWEYFVESSNGDLLVVKQTQPDVLRVYKLVFDRREDDRWVVRRVKVEDIGDEALFVSMQSTMSVLASNFPGCQPNSIYHLDDWGVMGIFNLENGSMTRHHYTQTSSHGYFWPPALWLMTPFKGLW